MTNLETIAAQRDDLLMKLRKAVQERDAALDRVAQLEAAIGTGVSPPVPTAKPPKSKRGGVPG
jgi:hypothetical protein